MAVLPPYVINETKPASSDLISQHPVDERAFRDTVESWLTQISDPATGLLRTSAFGSGGFTLTSTDAGAGEGPTFTLSRDSASPAVDDVLGFTRFNGKNSAAETIEYAGIYAKIVDPTDATEDGKFVLRAMVNGAPTDVITSSGAGIVLGVPLALASGGLGATDAAGGRTTLGLGTMATQNASAVAITGGTFSGSSVTASGTVTSGQNFSSSTVNVVLAPSSTGSIFLRPNGAGSSSGETVINSLGAMNVAGDMNAGGSVRASSAVFQSNADLNGSVWTTWGNASAFLAIDARIESRGAAYAASAVATAGGNVVSNYAANTTNQTLGSYAMLRHTNGGTVTNAGDQVNGAQLQWSGVNNGLGGTLSGATSWRAMGSAAAGNATLWFRYS